MLFRYSSLLREVFELKEKNINEKEQQKLIQKEKERLEKEELKDAMKKKEYEIQVKKI